MGFLKSLYNFFFITPEKIGKDGEDKIAARLRRIAFLGKEGKILQNVYVPNSNGTSAEIDLLYITRKGIFVIESKNYSGYIFANDKSVNWTSTLYAGRNWLGKPYVEAHKFYNPIWQNDKHIKALKRYLDTEIETFSLIVFSEHCEFKTLEISSSEAYLCQLDSLPTVVRKIWKVTPDTLTDAQVEELYNGLLVLTQKTEEEKGDHVMQIELRLSSDDYCPLCKGKLVRRTAKTGKNAGRDFLGCSNYPSCKYTKNL